MAKEKTPQSGGAAGVEAHLSNSIGNLLSGKDIRDDGSTPPEKPEEKPAEKPEEKPEEKVELKETPKPADKPKEKPEETPAVDDKVPGVPDDILSMAGVEETSPTPEEPEVDDDYEPPETKDDPKAQAAWKRKTQEAKDAKRLRKEVTDLKAQLQEAQSTSLNAEAVEELKTLRQQVESYENKIGQYDLAETKAFKERFDARLEDIERKGTDTFVRAGKTPEQAKKLVQDLIKVRGDQDEMTYAMGDESTVVQGALYNLMQDYDTVLKEREDALANWRETRKAADFVETRDKEVKLLESIDKDITEAVAGALQEGNWMYAKNDDPEWSSAVDERIEVAKGLLRMATPADIAKYVLEGVTAKDTRELFTATAKRLRETQAQLREVAAVQPGLRGSGEEPAPRPEKSTGEGAKPADVIGRVFSK